MANRYTKEEELLNRYLQDRADKQDRTAVDQAFNTFAEHRSDFKEDKDFDPAIGERIWAKLPLARQHRLKQQTLRRKRMAIAAAACILFIGGGLLFYPKKSDVENPTAIHMTHDVGPGETGGTLTLADGHQIVIKGDESGTLLETADVLITRNAEGQLRYEIKTGNKSTVGTGYNELKTGPGQQIEIMLPDQSVVLLNAGSKLRYPTRFDGVERAVRISGEGYFDIAKDKSRPFIVQHDWQTIKVLGTRFNVNAYGDEGEIRTTLLEGLVSINEKNIHPGQVAVNRSGAIQIQTADVRKETAWTKDEFHFEEEALGSVMQPIARWYGIEVIYEDASLKSIPLNAQISRNKSLHTIMKSIAAATDLHYLIQDRVLTIRRTKFSTNDN